MRKFLLLFLGAAAMASASGGNLLFNGSFEFGTEGAAITRQLRCDTNPKHEFIPLTLGPAAPGQGKHSLLVRDPFQEYFELYFKEFNLKADTTYRLSFLAKCSVPGQELNLRLVRIKIVNGRKVWYVLGRRFKLGPEWKHYNVEFQSKQKFDGPCYLSLSAMNSKAAVAADFSFDAFSLTEKGENEKTSVLAAVSAPDVILCGQSGDAVPLTLKIGNYTAGNYEADVKVFAKCDHTGKEIAQNVAVKLAPGEVKELPVKLNLPYGSYTLYASGKGLDDATVLPGSVALVKKYTPAKLDFNRDFCIGINGGLSLRSEPQFRNLGYFAHNAPVERELELLSLMGCRMIREHDAGYESTCWEILEPERGKWDFTHMDYSLSLYEKYQMEVLANLGRFEFCRPTPHNKSWYSQRWPKWIDPLCKEVTYAPYNWNNVRGYVFLPPEELWRNYVRTMVKHANGRIRFYEIFNEANGNMSAASYVPFMKSSFEEIRKAAPEAKVIGLCVTGDFGAVGDAFVKECLDLGAAKYMDIASFHPYGSRELNSLNPADEKIEKFRKLVNQYSPGRPIPLWNTELYYFYNVTDHSAQTQGDGRACYLAQRTLVDLGENVTQATLISRPQPWKRLLMPHEVGGNNPQLVPGPNFVVCNAIANHFEAARPAAKHKLNAGVVVYAFRRNGKAVAAVWNYEHRQGVWADLTKYRVFDLFGNPVKSGKLPVAEDPYYFYPAGNMTDAEFFAGLKNLNVTVSRPILVSDKVRLAGNTLFLTLFNQSAEKQSGFIGCRGGNLCAARTVPFTIAPNGSTDVAVPLRPAKAEGKLQLKISAANEITPYDVSISPCQLARGGETHEFQLKDGVSGSWKLEKENGTLKFTIRVKDATDGGYDEKKDLWVQDGLELFFDFAPQTLKLNYSELYTPQVMRAFILPRAPQEKQLTLTGKVKLPSPAKAQCRVTGDGYEVTYEMPYPQDLIGFALKVNDQGGKSADFRAGSRTHVNRLQFHIVKF